MSDREVPKMNAKIAVVRQALIKADVLFVQETHGVPGQARLLFRREAKDFAIYHEPGVDSSTGGLLTFVRRSLLAPSTTTSSSCSSKGADQGAEHKAAAAEKNSTVTIIDSARAPETNSTVTTAIASTANSAHNIEDQGAARTAELEKNSTVTTNTTSSTGAEQAAELETTSPSPSIMPLSFACGRAHVVVLRQGSVHVHYINVHNHDLAKQEVEKIRDYISNKLLIHSDRSNAETHTVWLAGDFNFLAEGELPLRLEAVTGADSQERAPPRHQHAPLWKRITELFTEFHTPSMVSHFTKSSGSFSRIDRIHCSAPAWVYPIVAPAATMISSPDELSARDLSDHAPIGLHLADSQNKDRKGHAISPSVFLDPLFEEYLTPLVESANLDDIENLPDRLMYHKELIREAARLTLLALRSDPTTSARPEWQALKYTTASRALWGNHTKVMKVLLERHPELNKYFTIGDSVTCIDSAGFAEVHRKAKLAAARHKQETLEAGIAEDHQHAQDRSRAHVRQLKRAKELWSPFSSRLVLAGIRVEDEVIHNPAGIVEALSSTWSPTFAVEPQIDLDKAKQYLADHAVPLDFSDVTMPTKENFESMLRKIKHSAPGPDGLPYAAWKAAGSAGIDTLFLLLTHSLSGLPLHIEYNQSLTVFIPKGEEDEDTPTSVVRRAVDTRPLTLKNSDNKLIAGAVNYTHKHVLTRGICRIQRGFVQGRQMLANIIDLDTRAHCFGLASPSHLIPILVLFDFSAAFPSVSHTWLFLALEAMHFTPEFINMVKSLYTNNIAMYNTQGCNHVLFCIISGILQGCPLSGFLFAVVIDPFLRHCVSATEHARTVERHDHAHGTHAQHTHSTGTAHHGHSNHVATQDATGSDQVLQRAPPSSADGAGNPFDPLPQSAGTHLHTHRVCNAVDTSRNDTEQHCIIRACADDVGVCMRNIFYLSALYLCYTDIAAVSNLTLKPKKCIIVPLAEVVNDIVVSNIKSWLCTHIPPWKDFIIQSYGKYLGYIIGPAADSQQWQSPISKWRARTHAIASSAAPTSVSCALYNFRAAGVLQFKAQILPMPKKFHLKEKGTLHKLLHLPNNALMLRAFFSLHMLGGPRIYSIAAMNMAARFRTAVCTVPAWNELLQDIMQAAADFLPLSVYDAGRHYAQHFDAPPLVFHLQAAKEAVFNLAATSLRHQKPANAQLNHIKPNTVLKLRALRNECGRSTVKDVQTKASKILAQDYMNLDEWAHFFTTRLRRLLSPLHHADLADVIWDDVFKLMKLLSGHHALALIKTYTGSWCTSCRFKEDSILPCLFGCTTGYDGRTARDHQAHYMYCPKMLSIVWAHAGTPITPNPLEALGLRPPCLARMTTALVSFTLYHDLKLSKLEGLQADRARGLHTKARTTISEATALAVKATSWSTTAAARDAMKAISSNTTSTGREALRRMHST